MEAVEEGDLEDADDPDEAFPVRGLRRWPSGGPRSGRWTRCSLQLYRGADVRCVWDGIAGVFGQGPLVEILEN